jgi:hypothetical protein
MKLSGHEVNSQLRQKLEMPTGRHMYVVLGTYERIERYERVAFKEARSPSGQRLGSPVNINRTLLDRISDPELKRLVQTEASRTESVKRRLTDELDALVAEKLETGSFLAVKNLELWHQNLSRPGLCQSAFSPPLANSHGGSAVVRVERRSRRSLLHRASTAQDAGTRR